MEQGKVWHAFALWQKALFIDPGFQAAKEGIQYLIESNQINKDLDESFWLLRLYNGALQSPPVLGVGLAALFFFLCLRGLLFYLIKTKEAEELLEDGPGFPVRPILYGLFFCLLLHVLLPTTIRTV